MKLLIDNKMLTGEHKGSRKQNQGCKGQLMIDNII